MSAFRALRHRDFSLYFSGQLVSWVGTWMQNVALAWMVYRLTGQAKWLGIVTFSAQIPSVLLTAFGGALADRVPTRTLTLVTQGLLLLQAAGMTFLAWHGQPSIWVVLGMAVLLGILGAFDLPARNVLVATTVPKEDLPNAIALNSAMFHGSRVVGPALAGLLLATAGEAWCFGINAFSYLAALGTLVLMQAGRHRPERPSTGLFAQMIEGFNHVMARPHLRHLFGFTGAMVFMGMPYVALLPVFAGDILHAGEKGMGLLMGAGAVGATVAALLLARRKSHERLHTTLVLTGLGMAVGLTCFAFSRSLPLSMLILGLTSMNLVTVNTGSTTLVNVLIPHELRGRVMALYTVVFMAAMPTGALLFGILAHHIGAPKALALGAAGCAVAALVFARVFHLPPSEVPT